MSKEMLSTTLLVPSKEGRRLIISHSIHYKMCYDVIAECKSAVTDIFLMSAF